jgi:hypothetical protein
MPHGKKKNLNLIATWRKSYPWKIEPLMSHNWIILVETFKAILLFPKRNVRIGFG